MLFTRNLIMSVPVLRVGRQGVVLERVDGGEVVHELVVVLGVHVAVLGWKFMTCSHVKSCVNLLSWLLIGCSLLWCQSRASLLVDITLDNDHTTHKLPSLDSAVKRPDLSA